MMNALNFCITIQLLLRVAFSSSVMTKRPKIAVIGGGWSGWSAAKTLCENGCDVTLLDAVSDPAGKHEMLNSNGKLIAPGERGFWIDYPNIVQLLTDLNISESSVFTEFMNSSFYSPEGLEATAPVFSSSEFLQLPSPLGQVFASFTRFKRLPLQDRASIAGLLYAILDLYRDERTFEAYDRMSAYDLFTFFGVSKRLIDDFLRPTLLVGLFKPPEELSAAVAMELLYYYALAHQTSFDVRWIKNGSVAGNFFRPLSAYLESQHDLKVLGNSRVTKLEFEGESSGAVPTSDRITKVHYTTTSLSSPTPTPMTIDDLDGVVLAVGPTGMKNIMYGSPSVCSKSLQLSKAASLRAIDCISVRLWLDRPVKTGTAVNVFAKFPALRGAGGTFFMLNELQKSNQKQLWGQGADEELAVPDNSAVVAVDFYNAGALLPLSNTEIIKLIKDDLLGEVEPRFREAVIVDNDVKRYPNAVSWFSPGSYSFRPRTVVEGISNLYTAGDWVVIQNNVAADDDSKPYDSNEDKKRRCVGKSVSLKTPEFVKIEHGSKGLCQERAYVSGLVAANHLLKKLSNEESLSYKPTRGMAKIIPVREDELQVKLGSSINRKIMSSVSRLFGGMNAPWLR